MIRSVILSIIVIIIGHSTLCSEDNSPSKPIFARMPDGETKVNRLLEPSELTPEGMAYFQGNTVKATIDLLTITPTDARDLLPKYLVPHAASWYAEYHGISLLAPKEEDETVPLHAHPFFKTASLTPVVIKRWVSKFMILGMLEDQTEVKGVEGGIKALAAAIVRVSFLDPPEHLIIAGEKIDDKMALGFLRLSLNVGYNYSDLPDPTLIDEKDAIQIDVGGRPISIPRPKDYKIDDGKAIKDVYLRYIEIAPPRRLQSSQQPECIVGIVPEFGEHVANKVDLEALFKSNRNFTRGDTLVLIKDENYLSSLQSMDGTLAAISLLKIRSRIIAVATIFPWRTMADYAAVVKLHQSWRDAILNANPDSIVYP